MSDTTTTTDEVKIGNITRTLEIGSFGYSIKVQIDAANLEAYDRAKETLREFLSPPSDPTIEVDWHNSTEPSDSKIISPPIQNSNQSP